MLHTEMAQFGLFARQLIKQAAAVVSTLPKQSERLKWHSRLQACLYQSENRAMELVMSKDYRTLSLLGESVADSVSLIGVFSDHPGLSDADQHGLDIALANVALIHSRAQRLMKQADNVVPFPVAASA